MISLSKGDMFSIYFFNSFTVYLLNLNLLFNLDALSPIVYACVCEEEAAGLLRMALSLLAALFLSFTVPGEFDHVVLLLLLLLGHHLLFGS